MEFENEEKQKGDGRAKLELSHMTNHSFAIEFKIIVDDQFITPNL